MPFGATNIVFLDADKQHRQHGYILRSLSRQPRDRDPYATPIRGGVVFLFE